MPDRARFSDSAADGSPAGRGSDAGPPPAADDDALLSTALAAAREAGALQREQAGRLDPAAWSEKGTSDFVTEIDRESERIIVGRLRERFPRDRILAEEDTLGKEGTLGDDGRQEGADSADGRLLWIIDPLDGTTNWLHGYPEYAVSIAGLDARGLRVGVVLNAATGETFAAARGRGATRDGEAIRVSAVSELRLALLGTGFPFKKAELVPGYLRALGRMLQVTSGVRRAGAAALDLCDLACGRLDAFWEHWLMTWDVAAGALIVREAGGTFAPLPDAGDEALEPSVTGGRRICAAFRGEGGDPVGGGGFLAGNGLVEAEVGRAWREVMAGD
ncbi:MAG: inositol monophosphatase family protein [Gemmatimonadota bacterium]|nr:inositol monophosphatase family protein [Gemmatimonadota bacterium]